MNLEWKFLPYWRTICLKQCYENYLSMNREFLNTNQLYLLAFDGGLSGFILVLYTRWERQSFISAYIGVLSDVQLYMESR